MTVPASFDPSRLLHAGLCAHAEHHAALGSTNDRARALAADSSTRLPALVVADAQTGGRGRGDNRWWTGAGSLAFSLLFDPAALGIARQESPRASLSAAVAIVRSVAPLLDGHELGLHWPNDVFAAGRKLAGILVEALPDGRHVLGIGLNTNNTLAAAPTELRSVAVTLRDLTGRDIDHHELLAVLLSELWTALGELSADPATAGAQYDALCLQRGTTLTLRAADRLTTGRCAGIAPDGALLLDTASGRQRFYGGVLVKG